MPNNNQRPDKSERQQPMKKGQGQDQGIDRDQEAGQRQGQGNRQGQGQGQDIEQDQRQSQGQRQGGMQQDQGEQGVSQRGLDGTERARDEQRQGGGPRYGGGAWGVADERGDQRFGHARNDDADPSELTRGAAENDDNDSPSAADPELAAAEQNQEIESGGQRAGFGRGEEPRKPKSRDR